MRWDDRSRRPRVSSRSIWHRRSAMLAVVSVSMTPWATCEGRVPSRRMTPHPRWRVPGSTPSHDHVSTRRCPVAGKILPGLRSPFGIERAFQAQLQRDELGRLLEVQVGRLHDPDAVLAGERAAHGHHVAKQLFDAPLHALLLRRIVPQEIHVQVAVAGVPVRERADARSFRRALDLVEQLRDALARHDDVFRKLETRERAHGGRHLAARRPQPRALGGVLRDQHFERAMRGAHVCPRAAAPSSQARASPSTSMSKERAGALVDGDAALAHGRPASRRRAARCSAGRARRPRWPTPLARRRAHARRAPSASSLRAAWAVRRSVTSLKTASVPSLPVRSAVTS